MHSSDQFRLFQTNLVLLLLILSAIGRSWNLLGTVKGVSDERSLIDLLDRDRQMNDRAYETALQHLNDMETKPTCDKTATAVLITSCQDVDGNGEAGNRDDDQLLALVKDVYATRLALCELERASTTMPLECGGIVDFSLKRQGTLQPETLSRIYLEPCAQALYKNQQQWTSYSNNRQKASVTCQAARIDIEKDTMIKNARKLANNTASLKDSLEQTLLQHDRRVRQQEEFARRVEAFQARLVNEIDMFSDKLKFGLEDIMAKIGHSFSQKVERMVKAFSSSESSATVLREALQHASSDLAHIIRLHRKMNSDILNHRAETAAKEKANQEVNHELALQTKQSLEQVNRGELVSLASAIDSVASKAEMLSTAIHLLKSGQEQLRHSLEETNTQIQRQALQIDLQFRAIHANANRTREEQEDAHKSMLHLAASLKETVATAQVAAKSLELAIKYPIYFLIFIAFLMIAFIRFIW